MEKSKYELIGNPITTEIVRNAFISAAKEMNECLFRSSYSPIIYESKDCAAGIFDENAEAVGLAVGVPMFLGNLEVTIKETTKYIGGIQNYNEGDVYILNDSYMTGAHLNDMTLLSPIFYKDKLVGFTANRAHWLDVGSKNMGAPMDSTDIYQEGIRIPPIKVMDRGVFQSDIADMICRNSRLYRSTMGDLNAQIAACKTGERRYIEILDKFGYETVKDCIHDIFIQSELMEKGIISTFPDGEFYAEGCLDNDGNSDEPVEVKVKVTIKNGEMTVDLNGSSPIVSGPTNCGLAQTISAVRMAYKMVVSPFDPVTGGSFKHLHVICPKRSIFSAEEPAPCGWYFSHLGLLIDLIAKALQDVCPERVSAAHYGDSMVVYFSGTDENNQSYLYDTATVGGWGAHLEGDGSDALVNVANGIYKNIPVEVFENNYPIRINRFQLRQDSGGSGKYRGGLGIVKEYETLGDDIKLSLWFERSVTPAWGIKGGNAGAKPHNVIITGDKKLELLKVDSMPIDTGSVVIIQTGGGGGYGNSLERDIEKVKFDYEHGYISLEQAEKEYGVVMDSSGNVDYKQTEQLRTQ